MSFAHALIVSVAVLAAAVPPVVTSAAATTPAAVNQAEGVTPAQGVITQTLRLGTNGSPTGPTRVLYSCVGGSSICGPQIAARGRWTTTLTVPVGTLVFINADNTVPNEFGAAPDCFISDLTGRVLASGQKFCAFQQPSPAPPPAPPPS